MCIVEKSLISEMRLNFIFRNFANKRFSDIDLDED